MKKKKKEEKEKDKERQRKRGKEKQRERKRKKKKGFWNSSWKNVHFLIVKPKLSSCLDVWSTKKMFYRQNKLLLDFSESSRTDGAH